MPTKTRGAAETGLRSMIGRAAAVRWVLAAMVLATTVSCGGGAEPPAPLGSIAPRAVLAVLASASSSTGASPGSRSRLNSLSRELPPGVHHEVRVDVYLRPVGQVQRTFWLYRPVPLPAALALILITPAGRGLISGKALSSGDRDEHLPYVHAGFAVMAYSIDGDLPPDVSDRGATQALKHYQASKAGLDNARVAIDLAFEKLPQIDNDLVFAAGHGAAGAHAILLAAEEPRVRAVVAYAPMTRLTTEIGTVIAIDKVIHGYASFVRWSLPENRAPDVNAPLFIYQSKQDEVVRASHTRAYVESLGRAGKAVDYVEVPRGDHVEGMLQDGMARGLTWLRIKRGD